MKKILAILATFVLVISGSQSLLSYSFYNSEEEENIIELAKSNDAFKKQDKFLTKETNYIENKQATNFLSKAKQQAIVDISQLKLVLDVDGLQTTKTNIDKQISSLIVKLSPKAKKGVDFQVATIPYGTNGRPTKAGKFLVSALPTSKLISGNFYVHLQKNLTFNYPTTGTEAEGEKIKAQIIDQIRQWMPQAIEGTDYEFVDLSDEVWVFQSNNDDLKGSFIYIIENNNSVLADISNLTLTLNVDEVIKTTIEAQINQLIQTRAPNVAVGVDYQIEAIPYDSNGRPTQAGKFLVSSLPSSNLITGSFEIQLQKKLNPNYQKTGTKVVGEAIKNQIIAEIIKWNQYAREGNDYQIISLDNRGSWQIISTPNADVIVNFSYTVQQQQEPNPSLVDISQLGFTIELDHITKNNLEAQVNNRITQLVAGPRLGVDYRIGTISYDRNNQVNKTGLVLVQALPASKLISGSFILHLQKTLNPDYAKTGTKAEGQVIQTQIINEIKQWKPTAVVGVDYGLIDFGNDGSWLIISAPNADVIVNFTYTVKAPPALSDISNLSFIIYLNYTKKADVEAQVQAHINQVNPNAKLGVDYQIGKISYDWNTQVNKVGRIRVEALASSKLLTGSFELRLVKNLTLKYPNSGTKADGEVTKNQIIRDIKQWKPDAIESIDYIITTNSNSWTIKSTPNADVIVNFTYTIGQPPVADIRQRNISVDVDYATKRYVEDLVQETIDSRIKGARLNIDYEIGYIKYGTNGHPVQLGLVQVRALPNSKLVVGSFNLHIQKHLMLNYPHSGNATIGEQVKGLIIAQILRYDPKAQRGFDYDIYYGSRYFWTLRTAESCDAIVDFVFNQTS